MKIIWNQNPLLTVVELDESDKKLLWHRVKIERLEDRMAQAHFDLDTKHGEQACQWLVSYRREHF